MNKVSYQLIYLPFIMWIVEGRVSHPDAVAVLMHKVINMTAANRIEC